MSDAPKTLPAKGTSATGSPVRGTALGRIQAGPAAHLLNEGKARRRPDDMRLIETLRLAAFATGLGVAAAQAQTPPTPPAAPAAAWSRYAEARELQLRDVAGIVRITPENRTDIAIAIANPGPLNTPDVRLRGNRLLVDGELRRQIRSCRVRGQDFEVQTARNGRLNGRQLPVIDVRVPQNAVVAVGGAVRLHMAPSQSARVRLEGCGDADIERVEDDADIAVSGSPDLRLYEAGVATISVAGAGDVTLGVVRDGLTVSIAGAGDLNVTRADGPTSIAVQGAGDVTIRDGHATTLSVAIAGAGDVVHNGSADRLDVAILGIGDVRVRRVDGQVTRRVLGGGDVIIGR
jgi:hypothetical protein